MFTPPKTIFLSITSKLVFNYDRNKFRYDADFYLPSLTQEKVSPGEVDGFLKEADTIALKTMGKAIRLQKLLIAIFCLFIIILFIAAFSSAERLGKAMIALIIIYFILAIFFCMKFEQKKKNELGYRMKALIDQHNEIIATRGWSWSISNHYNSIDLNKNITNQNPAIQTPPVGLVITFKQAPYSCSYSAKLYQPDQTDNRLSFQEVEDFMSQVNSIASSTIQVTRRIMIGFVILVVIAFIIAIAGSVNNNTHAFRLGIFLVVFGILLGQAVIYLHFNLKRRQMEVRMKELINQQNPMLSQRGLGWYCPSSLLRVDLIRYYKSEELRSLQEIDSNAQVVNQENGNAAPLSNDDVVINLVEIPNYENIDDVSLIHNDNVRNNVSAIDETNDITQNMNMYPVNDDYTNNNNNDNNEE